jgi:hypothetical protein
VVGYLGGVAWGVKSAAGVGKDSDNGGKASAESVPREGEQAVRKRPRVSIRPKGQSRFNFPLKNKSFIFFTNNARPSAVGIGIDDNAIAGECAFVRFNPGTDNPAAEGKGQRAVG